VRSTRGPFEVDEPENHDNHDNHAGVH